MKMYRFPDRTISRIGIGMFLFVLLMLSRDAMLLLSILGVNKTYALMLGIVLCAGIVFLMVHRTNLQSIFQDSRLLLALLSTIVILLPMCAKKDWQLMYLSILVCIYIAIFVSYFLTIKETAKYYVIITVIMAIWAVLAAYFLRKLPDLGIINVPVFLNPKNKAFYNFGLAYVPLEFHAHRVWGIFREPGVYQYFLILALLLNNYSVDWGKKWVAWLSNFILSVTLLLTFSTNGVVELFLLACVLFWDLKLYKKSAVRWVVILGSACILGVMAYSIVTQSLLYDYLYKVFSKIFLMTGSTTHRIDAIISDFTFFLHSPLVGEKIATVLYAVKNNTTSTMIMFAISGILGGLFHVAGWIALLWDKQRNALTNLFLLLIMFMAFNSQSLNANVFFWLFPMMAMVERGLPKFVEYVSKKN